MHFRRVRDDHHVVPLAAAVSQFSNGRIRVCEQALPIRGVNPRTRHDPRAISRSDLVFVCIDKRVERSGVY